MTPPQRPLWQRLALSATRIYLGVAFGLWLLQDAILFPGMVLWLRDTTHRRAPLNEQFGTRDVFLHRADGSDVFIWHRPANGTKAVVLIHGNGEIVLHNMAMSAYLARQGWDTVSLEMRGFGGASGWPHEAGLRDDLLATLDWVQTDLGIPAERIVVHGRSMGGGVAGTVAGEVDIGGWVFEATFDSVTQMALSRFPVLPVSWLLRTPLDTASRVGQIRAPILQMHSRADEVVPFARGEALAAAMPDHAEFLALDDISHQVFLVHESGEADRAFRALLTTVAPD